MGSNADLLARVNSVPGTHPQAVLKVLWRSPPAGGVKLACPGERVALQRACDPDVSPEAPDGRSSGPGHDDRYHRVLGA